MSESQRREVSPEHLPGRLVAAGGHWWVETEESWSWSLWLSDRGGVALDVVCGSVGLWEEWVTLSSEDVKGLQQLVDSDDAVGLKVLASKFAAAHQCGKRASDPD